MKECLGNLFSVPTSTMDKQHSCSAQDNLSRASQSTERAKLNLGQATREGRQDRKGRTSRTCRDRDSSHTRASNGKLLEDRWKNLVDECNVQRCIGVDGCEECAWVPGEAQHSSGWRGGLKVQRRHWAGQVEFWCWSNRKLHRALNDEHLREGVREESGQRSVERSRER